VPTIDIRVDSRAWDAGTTRLISLMAQAGRDANVEAAGVVKDYVQAKLRETAHPYGFRPSPSRPGMPPAYVSGALHDSLLVTDMGDSALVGPTVEYAREQELGGPMEGHPLMRWVDDWGYHQRTRVDLADRPYQKPGTEDAINSGEITRVYYDKWLAALGRL
jgi:phage gpG-like protein